MDNAICELIGNLYDLVKSLEDRVAALEARYGTPEED